MPNGNTSFFVTVQVYLRCLILNEVIVKGFDGTTNMVRFTDLKPCESFSKEKGPMELETTKLRGNVKKLLDDKIESEMGVSPSVICLTQLELLSGTVTWKYRKWTGQKQFLGKRKI